uniref:Uncharacterized protein n=1 Tax=Dunaliella tertiolecta TaxID=3047 RepID=A0A7S3QR40_DUNTE|eukprot:1155594-Pelagomonas_calceolata.AAC.2
MVPVSTCSQCFNPTTAPMSPSAALVTITLNYDKPHFHNDLQACLAAYDIKLQGLGHAAIQFVDGIMLLGLVCISVSHDLVLGSCMKRHRGVKLLALKLAVY